MGVRSDIREEVQKKTVTKIHGQPTNKDLTILEKELIAILANIPTTIGGGNHGHAGILIDPVVESNENDDNDDASSTALGLEANGNDETTASATTLDLLVNGSDAPLALTTALGLPANGSDLSEGGDATDASSVGNEVDPGCDGATAAPSIPPVQQSTLFPIFRRGNARIWQSPATTAMVRNKTSISAEVDGGSGTPLQADHPHVTISLLDISVW